jgi:hypothetical protein
MPRMTRRAHRLAALVLALTVATSGLALAQTDQATVSTQAISGASSRDLSLHDLTGAALTDLALRPGRPAPFEVRVTDESYALDEGFAVQMTMNHLYRVTEGGYAFGDRIESADVTLGYATNPLDVVGAALDLEPVFLLSGSISCADAAAALNLTVLNVLTNPVCSLASSVLGIADPLALLGSTTKLQFSGIPIAGDLLADLGLDELDLTDLPIDLSAGTEAGPFTGPDCENGIGAGDSGCATGTPKTGYTVLAGAPVTSLTGDLLGHLGGLLPAVPPVASLTGDGALLSLSEVAGVLDGALGDLSGAQRDAAQALLSTLTSTGYTNDGKLALVTSTLSLALDTVSLDSLLGLTGAYRGFPTLTVDTSDAPAAGAYAGTVTVTLVEQFN